MTLKRWIRQHSDLGALAAIAIIGYAVVIFRDRILSEKFDLDATTISLLASGKRSLSGDPSFDRVALFYRFIGITDSFQVAGLLGFSVGLMVLTVAYIRFARPKNKVVGLFFFSLGVAAAAVSLGTFSKDLLVTIVVFLVVLSGKRFITDVLMLGLMVCYGLFFRSYWLIIAICFLLVRLLIWRRISILRICAILLALSVLASAALSLDSGQAGDWFRTAVNSNRGNLQANSVITQLIPGDTSIFGGIVNNLFALISILFPVSLLSRGISLYALGLPLLLVTWSLMVRSIPLKQNAFGPASFNRSVGLILSFLAVQSTFEPDLGSAYRHLTPLIPLMLVIACSSLNQLPPSMEGRFPRTGNLLVIHWGKSGAGPRQTIRMYSCLEERFPKRIRLSMNSEAEILQSEPQKIGLPVQTYSSRLEFILGIPRIVPLAIKLRRFVRDENISVVYSPMTSIWQAVAVWLALPRDVPYLATIHDPTDHLGEKHVVSQVCRNMEISTASFILACSQSSASEIRQLALVKGKPVRVVPLGSETSATKTRQAPNPQRFTIGFVGRILEYKGLDLFVEAIIMLRNQGLEATAVVRGDGEVSPILQASSSDFIEWQVAWIPENQLSAAFDGIDIIVLPYKEASQSGVLSQAFSFGIPAVVTPVGGLSEQILESGAGIVAESVDAVSIANAVSELMSEPQLYEDLSRAGLIAANGKQSWSASAQILAELLSENSEPLGSGSLDNKDKNNA